MSIQKKEQEVAIQDRKIQMLKVDLLVTAGQISGLNDFLKRTEEASLKEDQPQDLQPMREISAAKIKELEDKERTTRNSLIMELLSNTVNKRIVKDPTFIQQVGEGKSPDTPLCFPKEAYGNPEEPSDSFAEAFASFRSTIVDNLRIFAGNMPKYGSAVLVDLSQIPMSDCKLMIVAGHPDNRDCLGWSALSVEEAKIVAKLLGKAIKAAEKINKDGVKSA